MSELRQDRTSGAWVIIAPGRERRPADWTVVSELDAVSSRDSGCPFCPGNEALLPSILEEMPSDASPGWRTRVVPNKFPALNSEAQGDCRDHGSFITANCYGHHEVIIENPGHDSDIPFLSDEEATAVTSCYRRRYLALMQDPQIESVLVFRNHGKAAGASLRHPHSQVVALGTVPPWVQSSEVWARERYDETGRCALCETLAYEMDDGRRIVHDGEWFVALVPFAAASPFELWLVPKRHQASFSTIGGDEQAELATLLRLALIRLRAALGDSPYNYVIDSASKNGGGTPHLHWRLRIVPYLVRPGGFELGAGLPINPSLPEEDAAILRGDEENQ